LSNSLSTTKSIPKNHYHSYRHITVISFVSFHNLNFPKYHCFFSTQKFKSQFHVFGFRPVYQLTRPWSAWFSYFSHYYEADSRPVRFWILLS